MAKFSMSAYALRLTGYKRVRAIVRENGACHYCAISAFQSSSRPSGSTHPYSLSKYVRNIDMKEDESSRKAGSHRQVFRPMIHTQ